MEFSVLLLLYLGGLTMEYSFPFRRLAFPCRPYTPAAVSMPPLPRRPHTALLYAP